MSEEERVINLLANKKPFEKWLKGFEPEEVVGIPGSCYSCPIAKFVNQYDLKIQVFPYGLAVFRESSSLQVVLTEDKLGLRWVADFIKAVDVTSSSDTISSATALNILETLTA